VALVAARGKENRRAKRKFENDPIPKGGKFKADALKAAGLSTSAGVELSLGRTNSPATQKGIR
jgi:hypothetical protein